MDCATAPTMARVDVMPIAQRPDLLPSIQILRAVAAILVVITHGYAPFELGRVGVDIFFVLSGFIMVHVNRQSFGQHGASIAFLRNRLARIVPTYWFCTALTALILTTNGSSINLSWLVGSFTFIPATGFNGTILPMLATGWTLNFEMFFYVIFGSCLMFPARAGLIAMFLLLIALVAIGLVLSPTIPILVYWTHPLLLEFGLGMIIALIRPHLVLNRTTGLLIAAVGFAILAGFWSYPVPNRLVDKWLPLLWGLPSAAIVAGLAFSDRGKLLPKAFAPALFLGNASYSIYLAHLIVLIAAGSLPHWLLKHGAPAVIGTGIIAGIALHLAIERPAGVLLKRRATRAAIRAATART